ncbi:prepilin peptidase [Neobacillus sp. GCM10023253]|uniref:A24 family peptidase n=1 Tax=Neobacillus sp. GCM10023253 TaxID=3252644 RepID=UPI0036226D20
MIIKIILVIILLISLYTDVKNRKILNIITLPSILIGFIYHFATQGFEGFLFSGKGFLTGLGLLIIPYLLGGMGAGDVKLLAAIGALMGTSFVFYSFIYIGLIGGLIALVLLIRNKGLVDLIKSFFYTIAFFRSNLGSMFISKDKPSRISFPYGIAIVLGTLCTLFWGGF